MKLAQPKCDSPTGSEMGEMGPGTGLAMNMMTHGLGRRRYWAAATAAEPLSVSEQWVTRQIQSKRSQSDFDPEEHFALPSNIEQGHAAWGFMSSSG